MVAGLENLGLGGVAGGFNLAGTMSSVGKIAIWAVYGAFFVGGIALLYMYLQYKYPVLIIEPRAYGGIRARRDSARKIVNGTIVDYELRTSMFKKRGNKEIIPADFAYSLPMGKKDLLLAYKVADGLFHPMTFENPISKDQAGGKLQVEINKDLVRGVFHRIRQTVEKYNETKWYEQTWFHLTVVMVIAIIELIIIQKVLQTAGGVGATCESAKQGIIETMRQKIA